MRSHEIRPGMGVIETKVKKKKKNNSHGFALKLTERLKCWNVFSEVHKVISLSQRAFTMEGVKGKATRFHIKAKVLDTLSLLWL